MLPGDRKPPKVPEELLERVRTRRVRERARRKTGETWTGEYGYGAGRAHPSVEFAACPCCHQPPGKLCIGRYGPIMGIHYTRSRLYREMIRAADTELERQEAEERERKRSGGRRRSRKGVSVQVIK